MPNDHAKIAIALTELIKLLVDDPHEVSISLSENKDEIVLHCGVSQADIGKLIGKQGKTARSLRTILHAIGKTRGHRYQLDISGDSSV